MKPHIPLYFLAGLILSCNQTKETKKSVLDSPPVSRLSGKGLAQIHCASCHSFVSPETLSKPIWKNDVLPAMGNRLGIFNGAHQPDSIFGSFRNASIVKKANVFPEKPVLAREDWMKIVAYYEQNAPDMVLLPNPNTRIKKGLRHFKYTEAPYVNGPPLTAMVKILLDKRAVSYTHLTLPTIY